jgi:hypothetical protein
VIIASPMKSAAPAIPMKHQDRRVTIGGLGEKRKQRERAAFAVDCRRAAGIARI